MKNKYVAIGRRPFERLVDLLIGKPDKIFVTVTTLGNFSLTVGGVTLTDEVNRSMKLWNVLAYLIMNRARVVSQTELIEQFWQEDNSSNPGSALKTLLYRIRALLEPLFGPDVEPITSHRGAYSWNKDIPCLVDADQFTKLCTQAEDASLPFETRLDLYRQANALYRGDFLPKLSSELWTISLTTGYHNRFLNATHSFAALLEAGEHFDEMSAVCTRASQLDPLDEGMHILTIRALLCQGNTTAALSHYESATDLLYRNLGVRPSQELRELYEKIMAVDHGMETDLELIQRDLQETATRPGAFFCEYGFFRECYRLEARRSARTGTSVHVALITLSMPDGGMPPLKTLNLSMDHLKTVLTNSLRQGDVVAKYSSAQFVMILHAANFENSVKVMDRIVSAFYKKSRQNFLALTYKIRALD